MRFLRLASVILFFVLLGALFVHSLTSINQDIGRHLKTGQIIWETKSVPKTNLFSFTEPNAPFINHHWLGEVIFFLLNGIVGLKGLILFKTAILLTAFLLIFKSLPEKARGWPFLAAGLFGALVFSSRTDVRPEIFSYLFLSFFIYAILRAKQKQDYKWLYGLPLVQLFWTNIHIYFILGPVLLSLFLIDRIISGGNKAFLKKLLIIFLLTSAATLANPNFIKGALEPLNILRNYGYSIVENQSVFFLQDYGVQLRDINLFQISLIILILSFIVALKNGLPAQAGKRKIFFELSMALIFSILAIKMIRNFGLYALIFVPTVALNLSAYKPPDHRFRKISLLLYPAFIVIIVVFMISVFNNRFYNWAGSPQRFGLEIPIGAEGAVEFVKQNNIRGPAFNNFDVGSFLIWKLYPEQKVFVDGRPEAYTVDFLQKIYIPMQEDPAIWKKYSDLYKINYVFFDANDITPWAQSFLYYISRNPEWPLIYSRSNTAIFIRRIPENLELINKSR